LFDNLTRNITTVKEKTVEIVKKKQEEEEGSSSSSDHSDGKSTIKTEKKGKSKKPLSVK